jgi:uncharacterized protein YbjT (DUF2867 family)
MDRRMKIVVVGGTGLAGTAVVKELAQEPVDLVVASRATGVNSFTRAGLPEALEGANVVIDVTNTSYTDEEAALEFFEVSSLNLVNDGRAAGVSHHIVLSIVGVESLANSEGGYFRAKALQERIVAQSGLPFTIVHSTQFFEYLRSIAAFATRQGRVTVPDALVQPIAVEETARFINSLAMSEPRNGIVEIAGPQHGRLKDFIRFDLASVHDDREVLADPSATYFGELPSDDLFLPGPSAELSTVTISEWLETARAVQPDLLHVPWPFP